MGNKITELWGLQEIQYQLGISRARFYQLADDPTFPKPVTVLELGFHTVHIHSHSRLWRAQEVVEWRRERLRKANKVLREPSVPTPA